MSSKIVKDSMARGAAVFLFVCASLSRGERTTDGLIQKVEQHYNRAKTLSVDFVEEYSIQGHRKPEETGRLTLRKQGKMRWDYTKPAGKLFISDGKTIYLYTAADNKVEKIPFRDTEDMRAPLAFLLGHLDLKKEFRDFSLRPEGDSIWLDANAKNDKTPYSSIKMLVKAGGEIARLTVVGRDESKLDFGLTNEQINPAVDDKLFAFQIPAGAEVTDAIEYAGDNK